MRTLVGAHTADRVRDPGRHAHRDARVVRYAERKLTRLDRGARLCDHLPNRAIANALRESDVVEHVPRARVRLPCRRLNEIILRPRDFVAEELLAAIVVNACEASVELSLRDEVSLVEIRVRHVASVELVHPR